jgi:hypothetical protein
MANWNRKRSIDPNNLTPANLTTLRRFVGARDIEDAINFTIASGVDVGKRDLTQVKRTYQFLTKIYNEKIEQAQEEAVEQKREETGIINLIKRFNKTGEKTSINMDEIKLTTGPRVIDLITKYVTHGKKTMLINGMYYKTDWYDPDAEMGGGVWVSGDRKSDAEAAKQNIKNAGSITLNQFGGNSYNRATGAFFPFINTLKFDLTDFGIYSEVQSENYKNNCLIHALIVAGVKDLDPVRRIVKCDDVPKSKLGEIAEIIRIQIHVKQDGYQYISKYGTQFPNIITLGLIENHYFLIKDVPICHYALENYKTVCELPNWTAIKTLEGKYYKRDTKRTMNSFDIIKKCLDLKYFKKMTNKQVAGCQYHDRIEETYEDLSYDATLLRQIEYKPPKKQEEQPLIVFDFETNTEGEHTPYLCCSYDGTRVRSFIGPDCAKQFLETLPQKCTIMAHNASYDRCFVVHYMQNLKEISRGNHLLSMSGTYFGKQITIKDSYNLITMKLNKFGKTFKLNTEKEVMPYSVYTHENIAKRFVSLNEILTHTGSDTEQFLTNIKKWDCLRGETVDIIKYSKKYCELDCIVLYDGYMKFREWVLDLGLDINDILTSASLAHQYFVKTGCYNGVYELTSTPQSFIQKCVVGGRCMIANNKKYMCDEVVNDFDAVSLYPSAMSRMGFLKGAPKVITDWSEHDKWDGYFVEIEIKHVGIHRAFPLMSHVDKKGVRQFTNDMVGKHIMIDKTTLEDLINFQKIEYTFVRGYYFNDGFNFTIQKTIRTLFETRLRLKSEDNPAQEVYKLIMNSGYGKSIMKPIETSTHFFNSAAEFEKYWAINHAHIKSGLQFGNLYKIKKIKPICKHHNIAHVGASILSMSKRIMNEVMCIAEDNGIQLMYQDTDSMHLRDCNISKLSECFEAVYGRKLIGKSLGQFHSDFELEGCDHVIATKSIFLGKKCYIDQLLGDGEKIGYHIRLKGIPNQVILNYCSDHKITPIQLYEQLYAGEEITFDLTNGSCCFEYTNTFNVFTKTLFERRINFNTNKPKVRVPRYRRKIRAVPVTMPVN